MSHINWPARMRRRDASDYLREQHGIHLSVATLAKLASTTSTGPRFRTDGRFPVYDRSELDSFAAQRLGPLRARTTDGRRAS